MASRLTLTAPGLDPMPLDGSSGLRVTQLDLGWPEVRAVADLAPGQSGSLDRTRLHGPRLVTITAQIHGTSEASRRDVISQLGAYCHPGLRPVLIDESDGRPARAIDLRVEEFSAPLIGEAVTETQVSWVAPSGLIRSAESSVVTVPVQRGTTAQGRTYSWSPDRDYPHADPPGIADVHVTGTAPASWRLRIYGYCTSPQVVTDTGDVLVAFGAGPVPQYQYWECDSVARTVRENSMPGADRRTHLDYVSTTWCPLQPGITTLTFEGDAPSVACQAEIEWFDQWLI